MNTCNDYTSPYCYYFDVLENLESHLDSMISKSKAGIQQKLLELQENVIVCMNSLDSPRGIDTEKLDKKINILVSKLNNTLKGGLTS